MNIEGEFFNDIYVKLCEFILKNGEEYSPREMKTKEIMGVTLKLNNVRSRILDKNIRDVSLPFAIGEWIWCMSGKNELDMIKYYAPSYGRFSDDGKTLNGAYGPRIKISINKIIDMLKLDKDSRRAVIPIYNYLDVFKDSKDIPCTVCQQFFIRNNKLNMCVYMRSNDIYLGLPYDVFNFTMEQEYIANCLDVDVGSYIHMVGSMHYYLKNKEKIQKASNATNFVNKLMKEMPKENLESNLQQLYITEEKIRKGEDYTKENQLPYFIELVKHLENYAKGRC